MTPSRTFRRRAAAAGAVALLALPVLAWPSVAAPAPSPSVEPGPVVGGGRLGAPWTVYGTGPGVAPPPQIKAATYVVADAGTGAVLAARGAHTKRPPASTLKALTALTLLPRLDPERRYRVVPADTRVSGSRVGLVPGSSYTVDQLFTALFLPSANDAAAALARTEGSMSATVRRMNAEARRLQALDTVARNPSGLDAAGQVSSAYDLALIGREGLTDPAFARYARMVRTSFPGTEPPAGGTRSSFTIETQNRLLRDRFAGAIGVKTGYTTKAGRTFIGAAERDGRTIIVTLMGIQEPTEKAAAKLLTWGFANAGRIDAPAGELVAPTGPRPVRDAAATDPRQVDARPSAAGGGVPTGRLVVLLATLVGGAALVWAAYAGSGTLSRRRIRRRYSR